MTAVAAAAAAYGKRWDEALSLLQEAAASGDADARGQLDALAGADPSALLDPPQRERINQTSAIFVARGFAPPAICDWLVERARSRLAPSYVSDKNSGEMRVDPSRTAHSTGVDWDVISAIMQERAARITNVPVPHHEPPNVISYEVGQKFDHHYDFAHPSATTELLTVGQRIITIVTYLNDDFEGAATDFPLLKLTFRGEKGDAILFSNVLPNGQPDTNTLHAGLPPTAGQKFVLSQWIRNRPLPIAKE